MTFRKRGLRLDPWKNFRPEKGVKLPL